MMILSDLIKAFHAVLRNILLGKLKFYGVWVRDLQTFCIHERSEFVYYYSRDFPQKVSVLSPLFSLFANDGIDGFLNGNSLLLTDDSTLLGRRNSCFCRHLLKVSGCLVESNRLRLNQRPRGNCVLKATTRLLKTAK